MGKEVPRLGHVESGACALVGLGSSKKPFDDAAPRVLVRILVPSGTHCMYLEKNTAVKSENEVLLPRDKRLRVTGKGVYKGEFIIYAELID